MQTILLNSPGWLETGILHGRVMPLSPDSHSSPVETLSDEAVVVSVLADADQYGILMERYEAKLDRYIRRLGVYTPEDREDVLQDIFIKAYRYLNSFDQSLQFSSWLYRIAHNEAISWYRKKKVRPEGHLVDDADTILAFTKAELSDAAEASTARINASEVQRALAELDEKYRTVIILRFFEHKEYEEISDILRIPVGTVGTLVHRGKVRLERLLDTDIVEI